MRQCSSTMKLINFISAIYFDRKQLSLKTTVLLVKGHILYSHLAAYGITSINLFTWMHLFFSFKLFYIPHKSVSFETVCLFANK